MKSKYQNTFSRNSARLKTWDYSSDGIYFITICSKDKIIFFGDISDNEMKLSKEGRILQEFWSLIPEVYDFAEIGEFVVMPNHFHAIISITRKVNQKNIIQKELVKDRGGFAGEKNPMLHNGISKIIRWFKGKCTFEIRKFNSAFAWQSRFYEHIISDEKSFRNIENYIIDNPKRWEEDSLR